MVLPINVVKPCILLSNPNKTTSSGCLRIQEGQLRLVERTNLFWTSSYYLMLLQCFWIPDFYLSATHVSWLSFQGCMCFVFPGFFSKGFPLTTPHKKNITQMKLSIALISCLLKRKAIFQPSFFRDYVKLPGSRWIWVINLFLWSQRSCYRHHRCHLPK